jgi:hypothetical protein
MCNEETRVNYLQDRNLLPELGSCSELKDSVMCGGTLKEYKKKKSRKGDSNDDLLKTTYLRILSKYFDNDKSINYLVINCC